jgi:hypothetical protein
MPIGCIKFHVSERLLPQIKRMVGDKGLQLCKKLKYYSFLINSYSSSKKITTMIPSLSLIEKVLRKHDALF